MQQKPTHTSLEKSKKDTAIGGRGCLAQNDVQDSKWLVKYLLMKPTTVQYREWQGQRCVH